MTGKIRKPILSDFRRPERRGGGSRRRPGVIRPILRPRRQLGHIARVLLLVGLLVLTHELSLFLLFWGYTLSMPLRSLTPRARRPPKSPLDEAVPSPRVR